MQTLADIHVQTAASQKVQARTIATHKTAKPEIPSDWGCAGTCSQPPAAAPPGSRLQKRRIHEFFVTAPPGPDPTHTTIIIATAGLIVAATAFSLLARGFKHLPSLID